MENLEFSARTRAADLNDLENRKFDVLVIGGGINGSGVANTLAQAGISTVLVEANDFASGTSSASSKLIHGGLRYLQQGRIREVRNLIKERDYLRRNTHIVRDIEFHILITPDSWRKWEIRLGLVIYNLLGHRITFPVFHRNRGEYPSPVKGYFSYLDAMTDDARLVMSNICSAHNHGALCLNYVRLVAVEKNEPGLSARVSDSLTGKEYVVHARMVVNCTGPWAAEVMRLTGTGSMPGIRLSKGIHLVLPAEMFPFKNAIAFRSRLDGRQLVPDAKSLASTRTVLIPAWARVLATPDPLIPPPMTSTSNFLFPKSFRATALVFAENSRFSIQTPPYIGSLIIFIKSTWWLSRYGLNRAPIP